MHRINDAIVRGGKLFLADLPFAEGQRVTVVLDEVDSRSAETRSIEEIRELLRGGVERFDDPLEPMVPADRWEMLR